MRRRSFLRTTASLSATAGIAALGGFANASSPLANESLPKATIYKTLKFGMIAGDGSIEEKFAMAKEAGFDGIELDSPTIDVGQVRAAIDAVGIPVDGSVCSTHWKTRHSSPDAATRATALAHLEQAIEETHAVGGHSVLLVVGHGDDGPESDIWPRSQENIAKALPLASKLGVSIVVENVWNKFLYDHDGNDEQTAERFARYIDEFESPWVGMQFDIGNHWKYANPADWIRTLGKRIYKLDIKGFSRAENKFTATMTDCDLPWHDVAAALREIKFHGWCAAEISGGGPDRLRQIAENMNRVLEI